MTFSKGDVVVHREEPRPIYTGKMLFYVEDVDLKLGVQVSLVTSVIELSAKHWFPAEELLRVGHVPGKLARSRPYGSSHSRSFLREDMGRFAQAKREAARNGWKLEPRWCQ